MESQSNGSDAKMAFILTFAIAIICIPYIFKVYVFPSYAFMWINMLFYFYKGLSWLLQFDLISENSKWLFFWANPAYIGSSVPIGSLKEIAGDAMYLLGQVDRTTKAAVLNHATEYGVEFKANFIQLGRLKSAILAPLYAIPLLMIALGIKNRKEYDTVFSLNSFAETMSGGFKELKPVVFANPHNWDDLDKGPWRMSPKIKSYLENQGCIDSYMDDGEDLFKLNESKLRVLLIEQLGPKWSGFDGLTQDQRFLASAAIPMVIAPAKGKVRTENLIEELSDAYSSEAGFISVLAKNLKVIINPINLKNPKGYCGSIINLLKINRQITISLDKKRAYKRALKESDAIISELGSNSKVKALVSSHAYQFTVLSRLIEEARHGGVLPSCSMIWIKPRNRPLYYMFNNLGRYVAWIEVCGFWGHYITEKKTGLPFPFPITKNSVVGIDEYLSDSFYAYRPLQDELDE